MSRTPLTLDMLPQYATDEELGEAVLGRDRRREFAGIAQMLERDGMPKICPLMGGRYVSAVKRFLDFKNGLTAAVPFAPNGVEGNFHGQARRAPKGPGSQVATAQERPRGPVLVR